MADNSDFSLGYALGQDSGSGGGSGNGMWGGDGAWWIVIIIVLFAAFGGGWGNGFGGGQGGGQSGVDTRAAVYDGFAINGLERGVQALQSGLCDGFYAMNTSILNGFHGVDTALCGLGNTIQSGFNATNVAMLQGQNALTAQIAQCCCDNRMGQADIKYQMATDTCAIQNTVQNTTRDIIDSQNAGTRAILDFLTQDKIASLQAENQSLKFQASQAAQNSFFTANQDAQTAELIRRLGRDCPVPAYVVPNPNFCYGTPYGVMPNSGSGCGCGC